MSINKWDQFLKEDYMGESIKFKLINMDGKLNLENVLFGYENTNSKELYLITDDGGLYITYKLEFNIKKVFSGSIFTKNIEKNINQAVWLGASNDGVVESGKLVNDGDLFLSGDNIERRKLSSIELSNLLEDEYHFVA